MLARAQAGPRCVWRSSVDRHFQRRIHPAEESSLRAHLATCARCRRRYDRHLLLGQLLPRRREDVADRLATGLGLRAIAVPVRGARWPLSDWRWVVAGMALGLGAVTLALAPVDRARGGGAAATETDRGRMAATGTADAPVTEALEVFRHTPAGLGDASGSQLAAGDRLVFAVRNQRWRYLTITGVDAAGQQHLLSPTRAIARTTGLQLLPERELPVVQGPLRLVALLTDRPLSDDELARTAREPLLAGTGIRIERRLDVRPAGRGP